MDDTHKVAAIIGITEAVKQYGIPSRFCPTIAIVVGGAIGYFEKPDLNSVLMGIILGATVTGGYAVVKRGGRGAMNTFSNKPQTSSTPPAPSDFSHLEADDYRGI